MHSLPSFMTLFRHALIATGRSAAHSKRDALKHIAELGVDPSALEQLLDVRERKRRLKDLVVTELAARYVIAIEQVTAAVANSAQ